MVQINGESINAAGKTLAAFLAENNYVIEGIAVECNEKIIPKQKYNEFILSDGDTVEIVSFVGGGQ